MTARFPMFSLSRRRLLAAASVIAAATVTATAGLSPARSAGAPPNGGDITFLIDSLGSPWIAESWEQNGEATQFTLHLKKGVTFSDGTPLDASAVVANLDIWYAGRRK